MRLLVVEDNDRLRTALAQGLTSRGFVVDVCPTGPEGAAMATYETYDCIVLDIMLPGMNGYDVLKRVRAHDPAVPVLMLTAKTGDLDETDAFDLGADDYVTKPFSFAVLVARINALLRRGRVTRVPVLQVGDLVLDTVSGRTSRHGVEIDLTTKERTLLEFLMVHEDEILTRTQIIDHCWDSVYEGSSNVVEVYIHYLRHKIDEPFGVRTLLTRRGAGYQLVAHQAEDASPEDEPPPQDRP
ncbi:response regulator transcription factor [Propionibacterium sp.]|uniref:response regulator transcription factor n=1 Tax=Propionibacterium sp. TaxID=1977903 RepID=UPI0039ED1EBF